MLNKSFVFVVLLVFSTWGFAADIVSRHSIKAKVVDVEMKKTHQGVEEVSITLEINKEIKNYPFSPFRSQNVFYKANLTPLPIQNIKIGRVYNIEIAKFSMSNKSKLVDRVYYIGEKPFSFGELE